MGNYGVTLAGFIRKPFSEIEKENEEKARTLFGEDIDLTVYSPIGLFVKLLSWKCHIIWQELEKAYYANWLDTAEGVNLDRLVEWGGLTRGQPQKAIIQDMEFTGTPGTSIPAGFRIESQQGIAYETVNPGAIEPDGTVLIICSAVEPGEESAVPAETVFDMVDTLTGIDEIKNLSASIGGRDYETDAELRARYREEGAQGAGSSVDAIRSALLQVEGVIAAKAYENVGIIDEEGRPPKSVECVVLGGSDQDIRQTIFEAKSAGIYTHGKVRGLAYDQEGKGYEIRFNRPMERDVYVKIELMINANYIETTSDPAIKTNIIKYIGGIDTTPEGDDYYGGLGVGEDVYPWRIAAVNRDIEGIEDIQVIIGFINSEDPNDKTHGYQDISQTNDSTTTFIPTELPNIPEDTYYLFVSVDGGGNQTIEVNVVSSDTWADITAKIDAGLTDASAELVQVETGPDKYNIRITSTSSIVGEGSTIAVSDAWEDGLLKALDDNVENLDIVILDAVEGMDNMDNNRLKIGVREIPRCDNSKITLNKTLISED